MLSIEEDGTCWRRLCTKPATVVMLSETPPYRSNTFRAYCEECIHLWTDTGMGKHAGLLADFVEPHPDIESEVWE